MIEPTLHMWFAIILTVAAVISFMREKISLEVTSILTVAALLLFGQFFPLQGPQGDNLLSAEQILKGFANPSLVAVMALLVMGQGVLQTDALRPVTKLFITKNKMLGAISMFCILVFVMVASAFMNNTPLVIIALPIIQILCSNMGISESKVMMSLSFVAILGGMTTLVGSSTNLLVSSAFQDLGYDAFNFFDFVVPGSILAAIGFVYVMFIMPYFLRGRESLKSQLVTAQKEFIAELDILEGSKLIGIECVDGKFPGLPDVKVRMIQRRGHLILPPFEGYTIKQGDIMIIAATRVALTETLSKYQGYLLEGQEEAEQEREAAEEASSSTKVLAEVMITPASRMIEMSVEQAAMEHRYGATVLGIQRRAKVVRRRLGRIRLQAGDVLLIVTDQDNLDNMVHSRDIIVLAGSIKDMPLRSKAPIAALIFAGTIGSAAAGIIPITTAAFAGAVLMVLVGCLNLRQAMRSMDKKIFFLVGSALALGSTLQATGAAQFAANSMTALPFTDIPLVMASVLFIIVAILTNVLTNNATAILFTPIAVNLAIAVGVDPTAFAITVILAANCSFASPIGYQTNLLVMGPGHYKFVDFIKAGMPLVILLWLGYIALGKYYFGF